MQERWHLPVFVENDVNLLALGESWRGAGQKTRNLAVIAIGAGIGAGLVLEGRLFRGANEAAGEVGYLPPNLAALSRDYSGFGPLEALAGSLGLVKRAEEVVAREGADKMPVPSSLGQVQAQTGQILAQDVYNAARQGDEVALGLIDESADYVALAVAGLSVVLNPEMILLGGELAHTSDLFWPHCTGSYPVCCL